VASISSIASVASLPAHLHASPRGGTNVYSTPPVQRKVLPSASPNRSCPPTPRRITPTRRQLPAVGTPSPFRGSRGNNTQPDIDITSRSHEIEDDETMTVVLHADQTTKPSSTVATASIWTTPTASRGQVSARASTGITRWVMKRSAYRF